LIVIFAASTLLLPLVNAQTIPKPDVPEFKLSYINYVYDVPAATSQWSGEPIPNTAYHVDYRDVYVKVRNFPNDGYVNEDSVKDGLREKLYYNVRVKNQFSNGWVELYGQSPVYADNGSIIIGTWYWGASDSEVTPIGSISLNGPTNIIHATEEIAVGNEVDFQVKALIGYQSIEKHTFFGEESDWSPTQTLTILPNMGPTSPPNTNSDLTITLTWIIIGMLVISVISLLLYVRHLKRSTIKN